MKEVGRLLIIRYFIVATLALAFAAGGALTSIFLLGRIKDVATIMAASWVMILCWVGLYDTIRFVISKVKERKNMRQGQTAYIVAVTMVAAFALGFCIYTGCTYSGRAKWNQYQHNLQTVDDSTLYNTRRQVEDTCRAMQAMYSSDAQAAGMYAETGDKELATQAAVRANRTAASYNEFILKNRYVWGANVPPDIMREIQYVKLDFTAAGSKRHD